MLSALSINILTFLPIMHFGIFQNINNYFKIKRSVPPKKSAKAKNLPWKNQPEKSNKIIREFGDDFKLEFRIEESIWKEKRKL